MNLEEKIIQKIKSDNIQPKSFWYFIVKDYSLWGLVFISILLASLAIAPTLFILQNLELGYVKHLSSNTFLFVLYMLPYPWIILCLFTTFFATIAWEKTKHGYKFDGKKVFTASLLTSIILGLGFNIMMNLGKDIDNRAHKDGFGFYKGLQQKRDENWFNPGEGRMVGVISDVSSTSFVLTNLNKNFSNIIYFDTTVPGVEFIDVDNKLRIIGYTNEFQKFIACAILPDDFLPPKERADLKDRLKELSSERFLEHPECKTIFMQGRAFFKPGPKNDLKPESPVK